MKPTLTLLDSLRPNENKLSLYSEANFASLSRLKRSESYTALDLSPRKPKDLHPLKRSLATPSPSRLTPYQKRLKSVNFQSEPENPTPKDLIDRILINTRQKMRESTAKLELKLVTRGKSVSPNRRRPLIKPRETEALHRRALSNIKGSRHKMNQLSSELKRPKLSVGDYKDLRIDAKSRS